MCAIGPDGILHSQHPAQHFLIRESRDRRSIKILGDTNMACALTRAMGPLDLGGQPSSSGKGRSALSPRDVQCVPRRCLLRGRRGGRCKALGIRSNCGCRRTQAI
jgi:hypothetical protein